MHWQHFSHFTVNTKRIVPVFRSWSLFGNADPSSDRRPGYRTRLVQSSLTDMWKSTLCAKVALWVCCQRSHEQSSESWNQHSWTSYIPTSLNTPVHSHRTGPQQMPPPLKCTMEHILEGQGLAEHFTAINIAHCAASTSVQWVLMTVTSQNWSGHNLDNVMNLQK